MKKILLVLALFLTVANDAWAAHQNVRDVFGPLSAPAPFVGRGTQYVGNFISQVAVYLIVASGFITALIVTIIGAIRWATAGGDEKAVAQARGWVTAGVIGFALILGAFFFISLLDLFLGTNFLGGGIFIRRVGQ